MQRIDTLTDAADQVVTLALPDKSLLTLELIYRPRIKRWTFDLAHPLLVLNGLNLCVSLNLLRAWRNLIPFGLGCATNDGGDVCFIDDFATGRASLYGLSADEVKLAEAAVGVPA
jgi:hypothetical protein